MWLIICLYNRRRTRTTIRWFSVLAARREPSATVSLNHPFFKLKIGSSDSDTSTCSIGLLYWYAVCVCMCVYIYIYTLRFEGYLPLTCMISLSTTVQSHVTVSSFLAVINTIIIFRPSRYHSFRPFEWLLSCHYRLLMRFLIEF